jgi:hypothetical protein
MRLLIGLILILVSPMMLLLVGEQNRAKAFASIEQVSAETTVVGDVIIEGDTSIVPTSLVSCPNSEDACLYVETTREVYVRTESIVCEEMPEDVEFVEQVEDRCDGSTGICDPCYRIASYAWTEQEEGSGVQYAEFTVGAYYVKLSDQAMFLNKETSEYQEFEEVEEGDERFGYEFAPLHKTMLVAGNAADGMIAHPTSTGLMLVSDEGYDATRMKLEQQDKAARNGIRFSSLVIMMLGFVILTSQVSGPLLGVFRMVPVLGGFMEKGSKAAVAVLSALIGAIVWLAIFLPLSMIVL